MSAHGPLRVWLGTAGWAYSEWVGSFYPEATSSGEMLQRYVEAFRFVEVDSTFYGAPPRTSVERWARVMPVGFRASFKAPRELVQDTNLVPPVVPFRVFGETLAELLGERLAMLVVQMQPSFRATPDNVDNLRRFADTWGGGVVPIGIEFRDRSWDNSLIDGLLVDASITPVSSEVDDVPSLGRWFHERSRDVAYIRLVGKHDGIAKGRVVRRQAEGCSWWIERLRRLAELGTQHVYLTVNNHYEGHAPQTLRSLADAICGAAGAADGAIEVVSSPGWPDGPIRMF